MALFKRDKSEIEKTYLFCDIPGMWPDLKINVSIAGAPYRLHPAWDIRWDVGNPISTTHDDGTRKDYECIEAGGYHNAWFRPVRDILEDYKADEEGITVAVSTKDVVPA